MASTIGVGSPECCFSELFTELKTLNPDQYNGASLLGLRGIVIKSHGSADVSAVVNAIGEAVHEGQTTSPQPH